MAEEKKLTEKGTADDTFYAKKRDFKVFQPTVKSFFWTMLRPELLIRILNKTPLWYIGLRNIFFKWIVADIDGSPYCVFSPIYLQQGNNMHIGKNFFCNMNCKFLDHAY